MHFLIIYYVLSFLRKIKLDEDKVNYSGDDLDNYKFYINIMFKYHSL